MEGYYHANIVAIAELHRQAVSVCTLLAGLAVAGAHVESRRNRGRFGRISALLLYISSVAFICTVCVSAVYLLTFEHYAYVDTHLDDLTNLVSDESTFNRLYRVSLTTGSVGMCALLSAMATSGYSVSARRGHVTAVIVIAAVATMIYSLLVAGDYFMSVYGIADLRW